jgi:hypothetical protein
VAEFNSGWLYAPKITVGPFKIGAIDGYAVGHRGALQ